MADAEWARCRGWLLPAMADTSEAELLAELAGNRAQLWPGERSALVTQLLTPGLLHYWIAGGDMRDLLSLRPGLEAWGRAQGCAFVTINGRKGWARVLRPYGYEPDGEELRKALR